jgi:cobalt-zinc-cadmium efflux system membrane fusion protein
MSRNSIFQIRSQICSRLVWLLLVEGMVWAYARASVHAHEGHQPLPTKGVQIDFVRGQIVLSKSAQGLLDVATEEVREASVGRDMTAYATTESQWNARAFASARLSGRIVSLNAKPSDQVVRGQILAELSSRELETLHLAYSQAVGDEALSGELLRMTRPAVQAGAIAGQRLLEAENTHLLNQNAVAILRIKAAALGLQLEWLDSKSNETLLFPIRSPIDGIIVHSDLAVGKFVDSSEHLFEIIDNEKLWGRIQLLEQDTTAVRTGQSVRFDFMESPNTTFNAKVDWVGAALEQTSRMGSAWSVLSNPSKADVGQRLVPGMVGQAHIQLSLNTAGLVVPRSAIYSDGLQHYVFIETASTQDGSEYQKRLIQPGIHTRSATQDILVEIKSGDVFPGDRVVVRGGHELSSLFFLGVLKLDEQGRKRLGTTLETVKAHSIHTILKLPASVVLPPQNKTSISSQIAGTIGSILVSPGQSVQVGDVLMELAGSELQDLQLELLKNHLDAELWRNRYQRLNAENRDALSLRLITETRFRAEQSERRLASSQQQLRIIGFTEEEIQNILTRRQIADSLPLRATIAGQIASFMGVLGESVTANQPLLEIHRLDDLWVEAYAGPQDAMKMTPGSSATVHTLASNQFNVLHESVSDRSVQATVTRLGPLLDANNRRRSVWLVPTEVSSVRWFEKTLLTAIIRGPGGLPTKAISNEAIVRDGLQSFVFVQSKEGLVERRRVVVGSADDRVTEIQSGLELGEQVVVSGVAQMQTAHASLR